MIDPRVEQIVTFNQAAEVVSDGRRPDYSTWWRWSGRGFRGIRLETIRFGNRRLTSVEAVLRFMKAITALDEPVVKSAAPPPPAAAASDSASFLRRAGILTSASKSPQSEPPAGGAESRAPLPSRT